MIEIGTELVTAYGCDPATAANEMLLTKRAYADYTSREIPQEGSNYISRSIYYCRA